MTNITVPQGPITYFSNPSQIVPYGTGATQVSPITVPRTLFPPEANVTAWLCRLDLLVLPVNSQGYQDATVSFRLPSDKDHNLYSFGKGASNKPPNSDDELEGLTFWFPNDPAEPFTMYYIMQGNVLFNSWVGMNMGLSIAGYKTS